MRKPLLLFTLACSLSACTLMGRPLPTGQGEQGRTETLPPSPQPTATRTPTPLPTLDPTPTALFNDTADQQSALRPEFAGDVEVLAGATRYQLHASVHLEEGASRAQIEGTARIQYTNSEAEPIEDLPLILWPNDQQYRGGASVGPALIDGVMIAGIPELGGLAVRYPLPAPLDPGEMVDLTVPFQVRAEGPIGGETAYRFGISEGVLFAPTFYPLVPRRVQGDWEVERAPPGGDTVSSLISAYWVELEVPADQPLVATGVEVEREQVDNGRVAVRFISGPVRDFAFALGDIQQITEEVDGVAIHLWILPSHLEDGELVIESATFQLGLMNELVGPYPYTELDIVDVPGAFGGIEYPGLVTIGTLGGNWIVEPVVHEVAHQWFYGLIGDDQVDHPWLDEAFAVYATALYYERSGGIGRATGYLSDYREVVRNHPEGERPIGLGVGAYPGGSYSVLVYLKGGLFYQELRQELGDDQFFEFLQTMYDRYRYGFIEPEDFQATAETTCRCELDPLFDRWVYEGGPLPAP